MLPVGSRECRKMQIMCKLFNIYSKIMQHTNYYKYTNEIHIANTFLAKCRQNGESRIGDFVSTQPHLSKPTVYFVFPFLFYCFHVHRQICLNVCVVHRS